MKQTKRSCIREIFSSDGKISSMRISTLALVAVSCTVAIMAINYDRDLFGAAALIASILGPALGSKAAQSFAELKNQSAACKDKTPPPAEEQGVVDPSEMK